MKRLQIILFLLWFFCNLHAQEDSSILHIPPLNTLIETALEHSPLLKSRGKSAEIIDEELRIQKRKWLEYIFVEGNANYGMNDQVLINNTTAANSAETGLIIRGEQIRYFGGIGIKVPVSSILNRSNELQIKKIAREQSQLDLQQSQEDLKMMIIDEYYKLVYLQESMRTFQTINQTLEISYLKAEKDLLTGRMDINDFGLLSSTTGKSKDDYIKAKNSFYAQYHKLQVLTGTVFKK